MNAPDRQTTPMVRVVLDLPARIPLTAIWALARANGCILTYTPQGTYRLQPERRRQGGWTLMEMMVVVAIIGVLATIAIPSYAHTLMRKSVDEAVTYVRPLQDLVEANHADGDPLDTGFTPMAAPMRRLDLIEITDAGTIRLTFAGGTVDVVPVNLGEPLVAWTCTGGTLPANFRPSVCRG